MLNSALTTTIGTPGAHTTLWEPFMKYLFDMLNHERGIVYVFMGKTAQSWRTHLSEDNNYFFTCNHPASAVYNKGGIWYSNGVFKSTTEKIKELYNYDIRW